MAQQISYDAFEAVDIRVGTVVEARPFPEARKPAVKLTIDFGAEIGMKTSSAQPDKTFQVCHWPAKICPHFFANESCHFASLAYHRRHELAEG